MLLAAAVATGEIFIRTSLPAIRGILLSARFNEKLRGIIAEFQLFQRVSLKMLLFIIEFNCMKHVEEASPAHDVLNTAV